MTMSLKQFISQTQYSNSDRLNIAGYLNKQTKTFHYWESNNHALPAAINLLEQKKLRRKSIYTNLPSDHWLTTYTSRQVFTKNVFTNGSSKQEGDGNFVPEKFSKETQLTPPKYFPVPDIAPPLPAGGLYQAANDIAGMVPARNAGRSTGLRVSLGYYMLATYSILDLCHSAAFEGLGNYVAAIMVSDQGQILAAGVNTGYYRHAEVTMLHEYFRRNPTMTTMPGKTVVFSTLTPCKQCIGYLQATRSKDTVIYFGQEDTGKFGSAGKEHSLQLARMTTPPTARVTTEEIEGSGIAVPAGADGIHKVALATGLGSCMTPDSIARQIKESKYARALLGGATSSLDEEIAKQREQAPNTDVNGKVLAYIENFLTTPYA